MTYNIPIDHSITRHEVMYPHKYTTSPTSNPTPSPTGPSPCPTTIPTPDPTTSPSIVPSISPTPSPTTNPTIFPSLQPTTDPSPSSGNFRRIFFNVIRFASRKISNNLNHLETCQPFPWVSASHFRPKSLEDPH